MSQWKRRRGSNGYRMAAHNRNRARGLFDRWKSDKLYIYFMARSSHMQRRSRQKALQIQTDHFSINFHIFRTYCTFVRIFVIVEHRILVRLTAQYFTMAGRV